MDKKLSVMSQAWATSRRTRDKLKEENEKLQEDIDDLQNSTRKICAEYEDEKENLEEQYVEMESQKEELAGLICEGTHQDLKDWVDSFAGHAECECFIEFEKLRKENEELKKAKDRSEQINDNAIALLECLNIPVGDIYPTDSEESESDDE